MNRTDLITQIRGDTGLTKAQAADALASALSGISSALGEGDTVTLPGFGNFVVRERAGYTGRNPQTGEALAVPARRNVVFRASKALKEAVQ